MKSSKPNRIILIPVYLLAKYLYHLIWLWLPILIKTSRSNDVAAGRTLSRREFTQIIFFSKTVFLRKILTMLLQYYLHHEWILNTNIIKHALLLNSNCWVSKATILRQRAIKPKNHNNLNHPKNQIRPRLQFQICLPFKVQRIFQLLILVVRRICEISEQLELN